MCAKIHLPLNFPIAPRTSSRGKPSIPPQIDNLAAADPGNYEEAKKKEFAQNGTIQIDSPETTVIIYLVHHITAPGCKPVHVFDYEGSQRVGVLFVECKKLIKCRMTPCRLQTLTRFSQLLRLKGAMVEQKSR
jgi:hypothetical protein